MTCLNYRPGQSQGQALLSMGCGTDTCYAPTTPNRPRPCPAKDKGREDCTCDTPACAQVCRQATPCDPQARYVWYAGSNAPDAQPPSQEAQTNAARGHGVYGYRSLPVVLADATRRFSLVLLDDVRPTNARKPRQPRCCCN